MRRYIICQYLYDVQVEEGEVRRTYSMHEWRILEMLTKIPEDRDYLEDLEMY
jgi:hypothetical protein